MQKEIKQTWQFNQLPSVVWEYLTNADLLEQWLMKSDFVPKLGHEFCFIAPHGKKHYCVVLELVPNKLLSYSWKLKNANEDEVTLDSKVIWTLTEKDGGTELQLVHDGFTLVEDVIGHTKGWTFLANQLVEILKNI